MRQICCDISTSFKKSKDYLGYINVFKCTEKTFTTDLFQHVLKWLFIYHKLIIQSYSTIWTMLYTVSHKFKDRICNYQQYLLNITLNVYLIVELICFHILKINWTWLTVTRKSVQQDIQDQSNLKYVFKTYFSQ